MYREIPSQILLEDTYDQQNFSIVEFSFILQRNVPKIVVAFMIPLGCLVILSAFSLLIPSASGENLGYSVTLLLALYVYKEVVESSIEPWESFDHTPGLIAFISAISAMMTLVIAINIGVVHWTTKEDYELSRYSLNYTTFMFIMNLRWLTKKGCSNI